MSGRLWAHYVRRIMWGQYVRRHRKLETIVDKSEIRYADQSDIRFGEFAPIRNQIFLTNHNDVM